MDANAWIGPVIIASAIAAMVNVLGWVVAGRRDRHAAARRRREKQDDIATALMAEITHYRDALNFFDLDEVWDIVSDQMAENETYMPVIPSERNDTIFRAILPEIHILPEDVIQPVTRYYNQVFAIDAIIDDLRSASFRSEPYKTRISAYTDYISLKKQALEDGNSAISALSKHLSPAGTRSALAKNGAR
jgi:hypothetical protein